MALRISLQNTSDTDQSITLFDSGSAGTASFIEVNSSFTAQSVVLSATNGVPSNQQVTNEGKIYYDAVFNPTTGYYFGSVGTLIGISATINGSPFSYTTAIPTVANRTFDDIQTFLTNLLRNNGTNPRPNAQVILNVTENNGVNYLSAFVLDTIESNQSVVYNSLVLRTNTTSLGVGGSSSLIYFNQIFSTQNPDPNFFILGTPNTQTADSDGWFIFQGNNLTGAGSNSVFTIYDSYLDTISFLSGYAYQFEFQLTEVLPSGNFQLQNFGSFTTIATILGNTTAIQTFSGLVPASSGVNSLRVRNTSATSAWNGQLKMRIRPMSGAQAPQTQPSIYLLSQINQGGAYLSSNPNIIGNVTVTGVGLQEILNSTTGNSYKVTSLYIWSPNPRQLTQGIGYGVKNSNGNFEQTRLNVVVDPYAQNQVVYRTNDMDDFKIDSNSFIQFTLKAKSQVSMRFEFLKNSYDEIKLVQIGLGGLLGLEEEVKEDIDKSLIDDFDTFYSQQ